MTDIGDALNFLGRGKVPVDAYEYSHTKAIDKYCPNGGGFDVCVCCGLKGEPLKPTTDLPNGYSCYPQDCLFFATGNFFKIRAHGRGLDVEKREVEMYINNLCCHSWTIQPQERPTKSLFETGDVIHPAAMTIEELPKTVDFFLASPKVSRKQKEPCKEIFKWLHPAIMALQEKSSNATNLSFTMQILKDLCIRANNSHPFNLALLNY